MTSLVKKIFSENLITETTQLILAFTFGISTGQWFLSPGWYIIYVVIYQVILWKFTEYFPPRRRGILYLALNFATLIGQLIGNWIINDRTGLEEFIHGIKYDKDYRTKTNKLADKFVDWLDSMTRSEEEHRRILETLQYP